VGGIRAYATGHNYVKPLNLQGLTS